MADTRAALALSARVGAPIDAETAQAVRELGLSAAGAAPAILAVLRRDGTYWTVRHGDAIARLRDSKGMAYLAELVTRPGVERHVFDLVDLVEGVPTAPGLDRCRLGDAGAHLDTQAKDAYRRRLQQLREAMDDAEAYGNERRAEEIQTALSAWESNSSWPSCP